MLEQNLMSCTFVILSKHSKGNTMTMLKMDMLEQVQCKHSLYEARIDQIWPFEVLCIGQPVDTALLDLQGQLVYNEEGTTTPPIVCVKPQLIQSNVMNNTHLHRRQHEQI